MEKVTKKRLNVEIDIKDRQEFKIECVKMNKSMGEVVIKLIKEWLASRKY